MNTTKIVWLSVIVCFVLAAGLIVSDFKNLYKGMPAKVNPDEIESSFDHWHKFTPKDGAFTIMFPKVPKNVGETLKDPQTTQTVKYNLYISEKNNGNLFVVFHKIYPKKEELADPITVLQQYLSDILASNSQNELIAAKEVKFRDHDAINFALHNGQTYVEGNAFVVGKALYSITYTSNSTTNNLGDYQYFMESFKLAR